MDHPAAGLLLTGGTSCRMGRDKATLPLPGGDTAAGRAGRVLAATTSPALEVGPGVSGLPHVADAAPGQGPLAAATTGWAALNGAGWRGPVVLLACDMPFVTEALLRLLAGQPGDGSVVPVIDGTPQPLCARFSPEAMDAAAGLVASGRRAARCLFEAAPVRWLTVGEWGAVAGPDAFTDLDTPEDLAALGPAG